MHVKVVQFKAMGATCQLRLCIKNEAQAQHFSSVAIQEIQRLEQKYSRYLPESLLSKINNYAGQGNLSLDAETTALLDYADKIFEESGGLFDISSGVLRRAWNFKEQILPSAGQIEALVPLVGWHKVSWHPPQFSMPHGMEIDLGGLVKEYAADAASKVLVEQGLESGLIELGGDIRVVGDHADFEWRLGIRNPRKKQEAVHYLNVSRGALASSGDYERCIILDGKRYSHILNPITAWPVVTPASVSVVADNCLLAGSVTTTAMLHGEEGCIDWLDSVGLPYCVVQCNGTVINQF